MARYLVIHNPPESDPTGIAPPTRMGDLAREAGAADASPRWLMAWTPDLHDDRVFTLWDADQADDILHVLQSYGFLSHMIAHPLRVEEWGPEAVLAAHQET
jgi:hypothetical protein